MNLASIFVIILLIFIPIITGATAWESTPGAWFIMFAIGGLVIGVFSSYLIFILEDKILHNTNTKNEGIKFLGFTMSIFALSFGAVFGSITLSKAIISYVF